MKWHTYLAYKM